MKTSSDLPSTPKSTIRVHLPYDQRTIVQIKDRLTIRDVLQKPLSLRYLAIENCDVRILDSNRQVNWDDQISNYENTEIKVTIKDVFHINEHESIYASNDDRPTTPRSTVYVHLPHNQRTIVQVRHGISVKDALFKALALRYLTASMCDLQVLRQQGNREKIDWNDDLSTYENKEIMVMIKESLPFMTSISHNFVRRKFVMLTCNVCDNLLFKAFYCQRCGIRFHLECASGVPSLCTYFNKDFNSMSQQTRSKSESNVLDVPRSNQRVENNDLIQDWEIDGNEITIGSKIGSGSFGTVYKGYWHGNVALKMLNVKNPDSDQLQAFKNEVNVLRRARHTNILFFLGYVSKGDQLTIVTEWCEGSSLYKHLHVLEDEFDLRHCMDISKQIAQGMHYLHSYRNVIHLDLKSPNIFLQDLVIKIGDFGLATVKAKWHSSNRLNHPAGSLYWVPPELIRMSNTDSFTFQSDSYSFSICLYELFARKLPYTGINSATIIYQVGLGKLKPDLSECRKDTPKMILKLIEDCIKFKSEERPLFKEILETIETVIKFMPKITKTISQPTLTLNQNNNLDYMDNLNWNILSAK